jgi:carbonic anhydrase
MKRILLEVFLVAALIGAGVFGFMNQKQAASSKAKITELTAATEAAEKSIKEKEESLKAAEEEMHALQEEMAPLEEKTNQLEAVKAALASGSTLSDLENAYKKEKNLSAERQAGLGALRLLTKGAEDPGALEAFRKALQLSELGDRKNTICAAQLGLVAAGEKIKVMSDCLPKSEKAAKGDKEEKDSKDDDHGKKDDGHGKKEDGKGKKDDGHGKKEDGKGKKDDGHGDKKDEKHAAPHWGYEGEMGPEKWGKEFPTCAKGKSQSPLDIKGPFVKSRIVVSADYKEGPLKMLNNGHTIQVVVNPGSKLRIDGVAHELLQFHFHRPSEEKIDGKPMAMVVHFVHKNADGKLAVLGVLLKEGNENPGIKTLWANLPKEENVEYAPDGVNFNPGNLLPREFDFYSYEGSLTTPPCTEGVRFFILKTTVNIAKEQVQAFPFKMNARPVQPLNGRELLSN